MNLNKQTMSKSILVIITLLLVSESYAQDGDWVIVSPDECSFSIEMPHQPQLQSETMDFQGQKINSFIYNSQAGMVFYSLNCSDYPIAKMFDTKEKAFDVLRESANANTRGVPAEELTELEIDGFIGIAYLENIGDMVIYTRVYVVENKLYQLTVGDMQGDAKKDAEKYFESFKVH